MKVNQLITFAVALSLLISPLDAIKKTEKIHPRDKYWKTHDAIDISRSLVEEKGALPSPNDKKVRGVTYELTRGRLGDCLLAHLRGRWIAQKYNLPLYSREFPYSDQFAFSKHTKRFTKTIEKKSNIRFVGIKDGKKVRDKSYPHFYSTLYFPEAKFDHFENFELYGKMPPYFRVDWDDCHFREVALADLQPLDKVNTVTPPEGYISVALHIRRGGGFDDDIGFIHSPLKFPPWNFYIDQLREVRKRLPDEHLYIYIFTDDQNPHELSKKLEEELHDLHLTFDYRSSTNRHDMNVLEDFFSLFNFDCLIRPQSNFSIVPGKLHRYMIQICPENYHFVNGKPQISEVTVLDRQDRLERGSKDETS